MTADLTATERAQLAREYGYSADVGSDADTDPGDLPQTDGAEQDRAVLAVRTMVGGDVGSMLIDLIGHRVTLPGLGEIEVSPSMVSGLTAGLEGRVAERLRDPAAGEFLRRRIVEAAATLAVYYGWDALDVSRRIDGAATYAAQQWPEMAPA